MQVHTQPDALPPFHKAVITIGTFDGVHLGHRQVLNQLRAEARRIGGESVLITFDPHPRAVLQSAGQSPISLLNTLAEKQALLANTGIDHLVIIPFTPAFAALEAEAYIRDFLVSRFHPHSIIIGYDHHFGTGRRGNYQLLEQYQQQYNYQLIEITEHTLNAIAISSTRIRKSLLEGDVATARQALGYPYQLEATVVTGNKLGRTIGYPTANLQLTDATKLVPGNGVYAVKIERQNTEGGSMGGMMNIGLRPTVNGTQRVMEVNIFDFDEDIYGQTLSITFIARLRNEQKFNGLNELKAQLALDAEAAKECLRLEV
jgi:riboflavin kinase/FMN adenylyltransferase